MENGANKISGKDKNTQELHKIYTSESPEQASAIYDSWSENYEEHMSGVGYTHPAMVASMLSRHQPVSKAPVLDCRPGHGVMGEILTALGYTSIFGFDASEGMLKRAASKDIYEDLRSARLGEPLGYADDHFAASVAAGVFTQGHAPLDGLDELVRVTRPGGHIVFTISRTYLGKKFETKARSLEDAGKWRQKDASNRYDSAPSSDDVLTSQVFIFEVV